MISTLIVLLITLILGGFIVYTFLSGMIMILAPIIEVIAVIGFFCFGVKCILKLFTK